MTQTRGLTLLLLLVLGGAIGYWTWPATSPSAGPTGAAPAATAGAPGEAGTAVTDIRLELLQRERGPYAAPDRNPFRFERRASAAPPPRPQATRRPAAPVVEGPTEPPPPPPPPPIPLRYIGFMQPNDGGRVAVLNDGRGTVFNSREGDIIEGRYRLLRIGNDSVDLIYVDGKGRQTIRLSGQ